MATSVRAHTRALPGQAGSTFRPIQVSAHRRGQGEILRRMATAEELAWVRLVRSGVEAAEARRIAGLPALR